MSVIITPTQEDVDAVRGYSIGKWKKYRNYKCIYCQYSSIFEDKILKHVAEGQHPWAFPGEKVQDSESDDNEPVYE